MVPLALWYAENLEKFIEHAERQTAMTHNHPQVAIAGPIGPLMQRSRWTKKQAILIKL
jgi:ADP-ribosylglycohydrolase